MIIGVKYSSKDLLFGVLDVMCDTLITIVLGKRKAQELFKMKYKYRGNRKQIKAKRIEIKAKYKVLDENIDLALDISPSILNVFFNIIGLELSVS